ncbi:MAG TPA: hypothetical protein VMG99_07935 [Thermoplasmata archaeon]|nr:hypothetical protein [Thermoplasmata archaeon]
MYATDSRGSRAAPYVPPTALGARYRTGPTQRWLVRFGYDGGNFHGWARQPGLRTVEGELRRGLGRHRISPTAEAADLRVASRTDRGVSARANALTLRTDLPAEALLSALNGIAPDLFFDAATPVGDAFRVRGAVSRTYRYFDPPRSQDLARWRAGAALLTGAIDVRSFGRAVPSHRPVVRTVDSIRIERVGEGLRIDLTAPSFVWGMVRKLVAALREVDAGRLPLERLGAAAAGATRLTLPLAEPEALVLWDVAYPLAWPYRSPGPNRAQVRWADASRAGLWTRTRLVEALEDAGRSGSS